MGYESSEAKREYDRKYAAENKERIREYKRQWRLANRERLIEKDRQYWAANRDRLVEGQRRRYAGNRESRQEQGREYYAANRERIQAQRAAYRPKSLEATRQWRLQNKGAISVKGMFERHGLTPDAWAALWEMQDGLCYLCGRQLDPKATDVDHDHSCCGPKQSCNICRRGLAHRYCNNLIGFAGDDPDRLRRIADELEAAKNAVRERMSVSAERLALF